MKYDKRCDFFRPSTKRHTTPTTHSLSQPTNIISLKRVMAVESFNDGSFSETSIEENLKSRRTLALYRIRLLGKEADECENDSSFCSLFLPLLRRSIDDFLSILRGDNSNNIVLSEATETIGIVKLLTLYKRISQLDPVLDEEIGKQGAHLVLSKLIKLDIFSIDCCQNDEANQDAIIEIQDLACEIATFSKRFPFQASPFLRQELLARLPLVFELQDGITVLVNQVPDRQTAQKDVGFVMWPSAVVLSRWLISNPHELHEKTVLELGAGCGLTGLVAAKIIDEYKQQQQQQQKDTFGSVILSDFNATVVKNISGNIALNDLHNVAKNEGLDFYQQDPSSNGRLTIEGTQEDPVDLVLAADVICQPEDAFACARSISAALKEGGKALVVSADSKHRFGVEKLEEACGAVGSLSILSKESVDDDYLHSTTDSRDQDMEKTSGFVPGMELTMYIIRKDSKI